jgi:FkbM family methyltransferase
VNAHPVLNRIGHICHAVAARLGLARPWLALLGVVLRNSPNFPLKENCIRNIASFAWPKKLALPARIVELCSGVRVVLTPHAGEFDFRAALSTRLNYEREVFEALKARLPRYDAILEIGANVGVFTTFFCAQRSSKQVPVFCLEPSSEAFRRLSENLAANRTENIFPIPAAVADRAGLVSFFEPQDHLTNGSLLPEFAGYFSDNPERRLVPCIAGAEVLQLLLPYQRILIKIDVEGAEALVLNSLAPLIEAKRPELVIEVLEPYQDELNALALLAQNYEFNLIDDAGLQWRDKLEAHPHHRDYLLIPRQG